MKAARILLIAPLILVVFSALILISGEPNRRLSVYGVEPNRPVPGGPVLRIGIVPERDVFEQRRRYKLLAEYISEHLDQSTELVTNRTYMGVLTDFARDEIDVAFLGSLVAALAIDRFAAKPVLKPESPEGVSTYRGVIFVRADSPILSIDDLAGRSIAMVKATTAADLFPSCEIFRHGLLDELKPPDIRWVGTHDRAVIEVMKGNVDAGAAKDLRLEKYQGDNPENPLRRLSEGPVVPNNALVVGEGVDDEVVTQLVAILGSMHETKEGSEVLSAFGARRFIPCDPEEYSPVYEMAEELKGRWSMPGEGDHAVTAWEDLDASEQEAN